MTQRNPFRFDQEQPVNFNASLPPPISNEKFQQILQRNQQNTNKSRPEVNQGLVLENFDSSDQLEPTDPFNLYTPSSSNQQKQVAAKQPVVINKAKIKFIKNTNESKQQKVQLDSSLSYTVKEIKQQNTDTNSSQQKGTSRANTMNSGGAQKFEGESPFKNLTTVNVTQNVVNYNIGNPQQTGRQGQSAKAGQFVPQKQGFSRSFIQEGDFDYHSDSSSQKKSGKDDAEEDQDLENQLDNAINPNRDDKKNRGSPQDNKDSYQQKQNRPQPRQQFVVEEVNVEVLKPQEIQVRSRQQQQQQNQKKEDEYEYYSEDDELSQQEQKLNHRRDKRPQQETEIIKVTKQIKRQQSPEEVKEVVNPRIAVKQEDIFDEEGRKANVDTHEEEESEDEGGSDQDHDLKFSNQQSQQQQRQRLQEVNPNNRVRANSTLNKKRQELGQDEIQEKERKLQQIQQLKREQQDIGRKQTMQQEKTNAPEQFQHNGEMDFDQCFKMTDNGNFFENRIEQQQEKSEETMEKLRIPGFPVAVRKEDVFIKYINMLMYDMGSKQLMMQPIPFEVGMIQFEIVRKKSGFNAIYPFFQLFIEKGSQEKISVLFAKKKAFNKSSNYVITQDKNKTSRGKDQVLGKVRSDKEKERYTLYSDGANPKDMHKVPLAGIRNEHLCVHYRYVPCSIGKLRKAKIVIPAIHEETCRGKEWKPLKKEDTMLKKIEDPQFQNNFYAFQDNPPQWNPKTQGYHYDFKGRISEASVKNFQIIPYQDGLKGVNIRGFVSQFGRSGESSFKLDAQYPFSIYQAFGLALTAFDCE